MAFDIFFYIIDDIAAISIYWALSPRVLKISYTSFRLLILDNAHYASKRQHTAIMLPSRMSDESKFQAGATMERWRKLRYFSLLLQNSPYMRYFIVAARKRAGKDFIDFMDLSSPGGAQRISLFIY